MLTNLDYAARKTRDLKKPAQRPKAFCRARLALYYATMLIGLLGHHGTFAAAAARKTLHGHLPDSVRRLSPKGNLPSDRRLNLALGLPVTDEAGLSNFIQHVYDPSDATFHQYLTPDHFAEKFGPRQDQYDQVV